MMAPQTAPVNIKIISVRRGFEDGENTRGESSPANAGKLSHSVVCIHHSPHLRGRRSSGEASALQVIEHFHMHAVVRAEAQKSGDLFRYVI